MTDREAEVKVEVVSVDAGGRRGNCAEVPIVCSLVVELDFHVSEGYRHMNCFTVWNTAELSRTEYTRKTQELHY